MIYLRIDSFTHFVQPLWGTGLDLPWTTALQLEHLFSGVAPQLPRTRAVQPERPLSGVALEPPRTLFSCCQGFDVSGVALVLPRTRAAQAEQGLPGFRACPKVFSMCISFPREALKLTFEKCPSELHETMKY